MVRAVTRARDRSVSVSCSVHACVLRRMCECVCACVVCMCMGVCEWGGVGSCIQWVIRIIRVRDMEGEAGFVKH